MDAASTSCTSGRPAATCRSQRSSSSTGSTARRRPTRSRSSIRGRRASAGRSASRVAVYTGARPRSGFVPRRSRVAETPTLPRRRLRGTVRARRRANRMGFVLGGIVVAFLLAFFSLAQTVRVSASGYDTERLITERDALLVRKQELLTDLNRLSQEPAVRKLAIDAGLTQLSAPIVVPGR